MRPRTLRRFVLVGMANTAIDVALFAVLHRPLGMVAANLCSTSAGMAFSFLANGRFTFGVRRPTRRQAGLFLVTTGSAMWVVQPILIDLAHTGVGVPVMEAKAVALGVSVVANYLLYRGVVWRVRTSQPRAGRDAAPAAARR